MSPKPEVYHDESLVSSQRESRMQAALLEDNPRPLRKSFLKLYLCIFVGYLCSATNGFDSNTFGGLTAISSFTDYFGIDTNNQGLVAALYVIGNIAGSFVAGPCADTYGRKVGMALGSAVCIVGAILQAAGQNLHMLMAGRVILGAGVAVVQAAGPSYVVEMSYPKYRGQLTGGFQACFFLGTIVSTFLEYGLSFAKDAGSLVWRLPLAVQGLPSVIVLLFVWLIPESPRWYVAQGQIDKARDILIRYHGDGDPSSKVAELELEEMQEVISLEGSDKRFWDFRELFNSREARHRTFLVTCIAWFGQLDLPPTSYYFPLMDAYYDGRRAMWLAVHPPFRPSQAADVVERRHDHAGKPVVGGTSIAFLYVFLVVFAFAWTPMQALYPSEVLAYNSRAKGLAYTNLMLNAVNVINTYVPPIAIAHSGWRYYILYIVWDAFGVLVIYLTFVETKGWSLEEIDHLFRSKHPVRESLKGRRDERPQMGVDGGKAV
ncbi:hypothetical protein T310_2269 [Rasamsonia emersonii CBS 393.64]|uniref:Major facilitator superfamily (MFS) profile domain-containing protein n=1 Tax=Rasamsonia emersonii (strain ATCC 16479 / CBS 393.64 / IMI 116815) TaxID=1408163 RepID=A0A0F4Z1E2_RASE3|nr:hypothetical protein T310_2269 [Rasamsonia emersonii CBS 393.64]KKA23678.1 hypothetical protein T310_2269 [Rasamsonia emersonii CBS 393.64]